MGRRAWIGLIPFFFSSPSLNVALFLSGRSVCLIWLSYLVPQRHRDRFSAQGSSIRRAGKDAINLGGVQQEQVAHTGFLEEWLLVVVGTKGIFL